MTARASSFVSFSANLEDVLLHRIFGGMPEGVFVDVGAADPRMENDCKALYDQGWSGINVEPNPSLFRALLEQRPRDRSFNCALGAEAGEQRYFEVEGTGLSTLDTVEAERCRGNGWTVIEHAVTVGTLAALLAETGTGRVDFLKVDVEGWEEQVLRGNDWSRIRPSVIMVEATLPERPERRQTGIAAFLAGHGYRQAHFDGLNDFYVREDFRGADDAFRLPPNVFDNYVSYRVAELEAHAGRLEADVAEARRYADSEHAARLRKQGDLEDAQRILAQEQHDNRLFRETARDRAALADHALRDSRTDCDHLRAALLVQQERSRAYAGSLAATHRDREELLILRGQADNLRDVVHALEQQQHRALALAGAQAAEHAERQRLAEAQAAEATAWIGVIRRSTSWRLTLPLRVFGRALGRIARRL